MIVLLVVQKEIVKVRDMEKKEQLDILKELKNKILDIGRSL